MISDAGKLCVEVAPTSKVAWISEELCIGCGICVKVRERMCLHGLLLTSDVVNLGCMRVCGLKWFGCCMGIDVPSLMPAAAASEMTDNLLSM